MYFLLCACTVRMERVECECEYEIVKKRGANTTDFCFSKSCELVSYTTNTNENVLLHFVCVNYLILNGKQINTTREKYS